MTIANVKPPRAEKRPRVETWHGYEKRDDYHWLKAANWREAMHDPSLLPADIRAFLEAENTYHEAVMADTAGLQETLFAEMKGRIKEDDASVPAPDGPFAYYSSYVTGGQHPRYCRRLRNNSGPEQLLLDGNQLGKDRDYFRFGGIATSPDHRLAAWSFDGNGSEFYEQRVRDLASGRDLPDVLQNTAGGAVWAADGKSFFYTLQDDNVSNLFPRRIQGRPCRGGHDCRDNRYRDVRYMLLHTRDHGRQQVCGHRPHWDNANACALAPAAIGRDFRRG